MVLSWPHISRTHISRPHISRTQNFKTPNLKKKKKKTSAQRASYHNDKMEITQKIVQNLIHKRFVSQKPGTNSKNARKKSRESSP